MTRKLYVASAVLLAAATASAGKPAAKKEPLTKDAAQKGCDKGDLRACALLADETEDWTKAEELWKKACDGGDAHGCTGLGQALLQRRKDAEGVEMHKKGCEMGDALGCYYLGRDTTSYDDAALKLREESFKKAEELYKKDCDAGLARQCANLGEFWQGAYQSGFSKFVTQDDAKTAQVFKKSCDGGYSYGCALYGGVFETGAGVPQDDKKAKAFYSKACKMGSESGCGWLKDLIADRLSKGIRL
jgi:uncharacterized protein